MRIVKYQKKICNSCKKTFTPNGASQIYCVNCKDKKVVLSQRGKKDFIKFILEAVVNKKIISCPEGELCKRKDCIFNLEIVEKYNKQVPSREII